MSNLPIPFNRVGFAGNERDLVSQAIANGHISGDGPFTKRCHALLESSLGVRKALLTTSCTHALEMTALLLNLAPGDEVIVPDFTFVSSANAYALRGAKLVFADVRPDTLNLDETKLEALIAPRTKAIVVVHYGGIACEMDTICGIAQRHGVPVLEDNAHGLYGKYRGRWLGTFGPMATLSFHETKNFSCGEGGALLVNDPAYGERAEILREKGTNRSRFFRGQVDKYTWVDLGSSYLPSDILAAFLLAQLEARESIQAKRRAIFERYRSGLGEWAGQNGVTLPTIPPYVEPAWHLFYLLLPSIEARTALIAALKAEGILAIFHYLPLHRSEMGRAMGGAVGDCPVSASASERLLRLPFFNELTEVEQLRVIDTIVRFRCG